MSANIYTTPVKTMSMNINFLNPFMLDLLTNSDKEKVKINISTLKKEMLSVWTIELQEFTRLAQL